MNSDRRQRKKDLSCSKEGGLGRGECMHDSRRCRTWNADTDGIRG